MTDQHHALRVERADDGGDVAPAYASAECRARSRLEAPWPARSSATTVWLAAKASRCVSHQRHEPSQPWTNTSAVGAVPVRS